MADTRKPTSQVVSTQRERAARFALQMAEQARKFGARIAELRDERGWKQRDLVAAMAALGDQAINTNQLSRYENGGAMPGEQRQSWFAEALETTVADLHAGPLEERPQSEETPDLMATLNGASEIAQRLDRMEKMLVGLQTDLAEIGVALARDRAPAPPRRRAKPASTK